MLLSLFVVVNKLSQETEKSQGKLCFRTNHSSEYHGCLVGINIGDSSATKKKHECFGYVETPIITKYNKLMGV